mgnify:CR=1 FL=1
MENTKKWLTSIVLVGLFLFGTAVGAWLIWEWKVAPLEEKNEALQQTIAFQENQIKDFKIALGKAEEDRKKLEVTATGRQTQSLYYQPKALDPATGEKEGTDIEFLRKKSTLQVKVNQGKPVGIPLLEGESQAFEEGKLMVEQAFAGTLELKLPEPKQQKTAFGFGVDYDKDNGAHWAIGLQQRVNPTVTLEGTLKGKGSVTGIEGKAWFWFR